jgi:hypothetical protein
MDRRLLLLLLFCSWHKNEAVNVLKKCYKNQAINCPILYSYKMCRGRLLLGRDEHTLRLLQGTSFQQVKGTFFFLFFGLIEAEGTLKEGFCPFPCIYVKFLNAQP